MQREGIELVIYGEPASKANSRQLVRFGDRPAIIKSQKARNYETDARRQIPASIRSNYAGKVAVDIHIFYASERPDLDESVILDVLQARFERQAGERVCTWPGVYLNDRQVREKHVYHAIDKRQPRARIVVRPL